jgi:hypothetical protein
MLSIRKPTLYPLSYGSRELDCESAGQSVVRAPIHPAVISRLRRVAVGPWEGEATRRSAADSVRRRAQRRSRPRG